MKIFDYNRQAAADYAKRWAYARNPKFYDFSNLGGDCTNYASQCIFAGAQVMNFTPTFGWFYESLSNRTPSWTGVEFLYEFLVQNKGLGPFAKEVSLNELEVGDVVQLGRATGDFYHSPVVVGVKNGQITVAAHSYDVYGKLLTSYKFATARGIHILGVRKDRPDTD